MHRIDDMEASKFTNLASIRVSMGTSQTACDGEDVCSKSLMMIYADYSYLCEIYNETSECYSRCVFH